MLEFFGLMQLTVLVEFVDLTEKVVLEQVEKPMDIEYIEKTAGKEHLWYDKKGARAPVCEHKVSLFVLAELVYRSSSYQIQVLNSEKHDSKKLQGHLVDFEGQHVHYILMRTIGKMCSRL